MSACATLYNHYIKVHQATYIELNEITLKNLDQLIQGRKLISKELLRTDISEAAKSMLHQHYDWYNNRIKELLAI